MLPNINHILYATDLSGQARKALAYAVSLADAYGAALTVLHVFEEIAPNAELLTASFLGYGTVEEMKQKSRERIVDEIKSRLNAMCDELGCQLPACRFTLSEIQVETGRPSKFLSDQVNSGRFDLLVMGRRDFGLLDQILVGHRTRQVLRSSPIPILLVPVAPDAK